MFSFSFSINYCAVIVFVASRIHSDGFLFVGHPLVVVDDILVEKLLANFAVKGDEPLVGELIKFHIMSLFPVVHRSANLNFVVSGTSVVEHENLWLLAEHSLVKRRPYLVDLGQPVWGTISFIFSSSMIYILEYLLFLVGAENLLNDADGGVVLGSPWWELLGELVDDCVVDKDLAPQSVEL